MENKLEIESYLDSIAGEQLFKEDQTELVNKLQVKDSRGRIQKSSFQLNKYLEANNFKYKIVTRRTSKVRYWEVINWISFEEYLKNYCSAKTIKNILHKLSS